MAIGLMEYDFGPELNDNGFTGVITKQPPGIRQTSPLMPRVNSDDNEMVGVASIQHLAPLGAYIDWNIITGGFLKGQPCGGGLTGGFIPFRSTKTEREAVGRPSLKERYRAAAALECRQPAKPPSTMPRCISIPCKNHRDAIVVARRAEHGCPK
jgi:hypothetical protein